MAVSGEVREVQGVQPRATGLPAVPLVERGRGTGGTASPACTPCTSGKDCAGVQLQAAPLLAVPLVPRVPLQKQQRTKRMGTLLDLIASLAPAPAVTATAAPLIEVTRAPAANDPQQPASEPPQTPAAPALVSTPAPAAEVASEPHRNAWTITRGGRPICRMVGAPCTRTEALAEARWRWPDADILEN